MTTTCPLLADACVWAFVFQAETTRFYGLLRRVPETIEGSGFKPVGLTPTLRWCRVMSRPPR